jgi:DNA helicase-2/ATP-dependent DNA helicase PcrA
LLVDEAQDLSPLQWRVVERLAEQARRVVIAGDDDQAIYRWAGADVEHLIDMPGAVQVLGKSWRCPPVIQKLSQEIISGVRHRREKVWAPRDGEAGGVARVGRFDEADCNDAWAEGDETQPVLVLARNNYLLKEQVEPALRAQGIVYESSTGKSSLDPRALRAVSTWETLRAGREAVTVNEARGMYEFISSNTGVKRGYKKLAALGEEEDEPVDMRMLIDYGGLLVDPTLVWHEALDKLPREEMSYMLAARRRGEKLRSRPRVRLSTIHSAKGGEAHHVVLMTEMAKRTFREMDQWPDDERRVWYVGVTRAKTRLTIVHGETAQVCPWL